MYKLERPFYTKKMFDTIKRVNLTQYNSSPDTINIIEKKAPTDDSARLYGELLEKAKKNIIGEVRVEENYMNGSVLFFCPTLENFSQIQYATKFKLNGVEHLVRGEFSVRDVIWSTDKKRKGVELLFKSISEHIAIQIIKENEGTITSSWSPLMMI